MTNDNIQYIIQTFYIKRDKQQNNQPYNYYRKVTKLI